MQGPSATRSRQSGDVAGIWMWRSLAGQWVQGWRQHPCLRAVTFFMPWIAVGHEAHTRPSRIENTSEEMGAMKTVNKKLLDWVAEIEALCQPDARRVGRWVTGRIRPAHEADGRDGDGDQVE